MSGLPPGGLVFVGDVHLGALDRDLEDFVTFLRRLAGRVSRVVLVGDLFEVWLGRSELQEPHHVRVVEALRELRAAGTSIAYVEGNRDYRIGTLLRGAPFDDVIEEDGIEGIGGKSLVVSHGDLVNEHDRLYRTWRRFSRSRLVWDVFNALPSRLRLRAAERLRRSLHGTNRPYKTGFPEEEVRRFAARWHAVGHHAVVLGHFHVEKDLEGRSPDPAGRILVLPEWKGSRRHLRASRDGRIAFEDSEF